MVYDIMNDKQRKAYEEFFETDFSFEIPKLARFRVNAFNQNRGAGAVFRNIPSHHPDAGRPDGAEDLPRPVHAAARPGAGDRPDRLGQVDHAGRHGQLLQRQPSRPHHHHRGPDRVRARVQALPDQPARGARATPSASARRCARRCARTRTSSWSAKCATWRPSAWRSPPPRPATWCSARCTPARPPRPSTASSTCSRARRRTWCARCCPSRCAR